MLCASLALSAGDKGASVGSSVLDWSICYRLKAPVALPVSISELECEIMEYGAWFSMTCSMKAWWSGHVHK